MSRCENENPEEIGEPKLNEPERKKKKKEGTTSCNEANKKKRSRRHKNT